jgi:hypothetical protein
MIAEVEGLHEAEKLVEKYLRNMHSSETKNEISYRVLEMPLPSQGSAVG